MFIVSIKLNCLISNLASKLCKNLFRIIKCSFLSVISWHGVTLLEKSKRIHLHHHLNKELKEAKLLLLLKKNQKKRKKKQQLRTKVRKNLLKRKLK